MEPLIVGERGQITIPKEIRKKYGIKPKQILLLEERDGELVIKPAVIVPLEKLKKLARDIDLDLIKKFLQENELEPEEEEEILRSWKL
ncbi:AbrB/MazE/SpoVT family DNA-binding domain-containing protein [Thermodesulfatator atlanticus]|uniref:AbrB/MazE/SpoVT family DNA-binding domain-containing protein n=1 Tax=Thermodesulfatator atlanticus TaxID=501497 RepID=UPI0003B54DD6|nr:AbrB/MazE/SpoVT family DNA-binding domain-containing protein [Thermodesulfatator atlanticus]